MKKYQACYDHGLLGQTVTQFICQDHTCTVIVFLQILQLSQQWIGTSSHVNNTVHITNIHGYILYQAENAI